MSIDFKSTKGIFQQIADNLCHQILDGKLAPGERVPSVRDLAMEFEVNRNTLLRTYAMLEDSGVIVNKRGIGFFVADNAIELIRTSEKQEFYTNDLPMLIQKIRLLRLTADDLNDLLLAINENKKQ